MRRQISRPQVASANLICVALFLFVAICTDSVAAQTRSAQTNFAALRARERALELIEQQISVTRTFDNIAQRINVLVRSADLLWVYREPRSREVLREAFDLAGRSFRETAEKQRQEGAQSSRPGVDQRYVVIGAIARHDQAWAGILTKQMLAQQEEDARSSMNDARGDMRTAMKLLDTASSLISSDGAAALAFARMSLSYVASPGLPVFLYRLAEVNQTAANQFYQESFNAYRAKSMDEFLYLSSYPFGNDRDAGNMPAYTMYRVPANFQQSRDLRRLFIQALLFRGGQILNGQSGPDNAAADRDARQIWLAASRLTPQVRQTEPDLIEQLSQVQSGLFALLPQNSQTSALKSLAKDKSPKRTLSEAVETAAREVDPDKHDQLLVDAIITAGESESLEHLLGAAENVLDANVRQQLTDWICFTQTRVAIRNNQFELARALASKIGELDQRAYLLSEISGGVLKSLDDQAQAREILDEVAATAAKAPNSMVSARALLAVAYLYLKIDPNRSISVLSDAIKCINRLEVADFSRQVVMRKIEGKNFGSYASFQTPGFNPENAIREMGKQHFDDALYLAGSFSDKALRSLTTLALAEISLQQAEQQTKEQKRTQ